MRRLTSLMLVAGLVLSGVGCIAVVSDTETHVKQHSKQAVAMDGTIYIVDMSSYDVEKVDASAVAAARTAVPEATTMADDD